MKQINLAGDLRKARTRTRTRPDGGRTWSWIGRALFEAALIVFAVVLGFMVTAWREDADSVARGEAALERITAELRANRETVAGILPYHQKVADALARLRKTPPDTPLFSTLFGADLPTPGVAPHGVGDLYLHDEAWTTALSRDALARVDFELVQAIALVYGGAEFGAAASWRTILEQIGEREAFAPDHDGVALTRMSYTYQELVAQERFLIRRYDEVLAKLDER